MNRWQVSLRNAVLAAVCHLALGGATGGQAQAAGIELPATARQSYLLHCMGCHTADGSGIAGKVPPLRNSLARVLAAPAGRQYVIRVPGASNSSLSDAGLADVLNFIFLSMNRDELPADFTPYTAAEVRAARLPALLDVTPQRAALVRALDGRAPGEPDPAGAFPRARRRQAPMDGGLYRQDR